ncbi:hypothetical protein SynMITS9220_00657 [Synechococcus sp. MIT S9220]|uniref:hypothetical protein n=1 Tax=unclassified Synechococcus TaxID=2626047 RepID=UPI00164CB93A|nr:hypothetical protein [Synechococcus sp. MIT S9220]NOL47637.1 hypothetical protein [Synechococcus sp. MIT S9220]QNJ21970.1 hypothetical protein SynMITS9220_00657 [Synechococcus sp. MIT S9220]
MATRVALDEFLSFILILQSRQALRRRFLQLPTREARGQMMTRLGFDKFQIWAALDTLSFEIDGQTYTFASWIAGRQKGNGVSIVPFSTIIDSACQLGADETHASIRLQLLAVQGTLRAVAGGSGRPVPQRSGNGSVAFGVGRQLEYEPLHDSQGFQDHQPLSVEPDVFSDQSVGPGSVDVAGVLSMPDDVFEGSGPQALREGFGSDAPFERSESNLFSSDQSSSSSDREQPSDASASQIQDLSSRESSSREGQGGSFGSGPLDGDRGGLISNVREQIDQKTSIPIDWSSSSVDLYDGKYGDVSLSASIDGTLNPSIERDGKGDYSLTFDQSDLNFNLTLSGEATYTKLIPEYDLEFSATLGTSLTLTLEKNPGQQGISGYNISSSGLELEMVAGFIVHPEYDGVYLSASIDPELSWTIDASLQDGIQIGRPEFALNFDYSFNKPDFWDAVTGAFDRVGDDFADFFKNPSWSNFVDSVDSLVNLGEFLTSPEFMNWAVDQASAYVKSVVNEAASYAEQALSDVYAGLQSAAAQVESAVTKAADEVWSAASDWASEASSWASDAWDSTSDWASDTWDDVTSW